VSSMELMSWDSFPSIWERRIVISGVYSASRVCSLSFFLILLSSLSSRAGNAHKWCKSFFSNFAKPSVPTELVLLNTLQQ